jgi:dTDP-4-dehydrorhamnose 3,5-epimerase
LTASDGNQIYVPIGFGHAFVTIEDCTEISYKVSNLYSAELDAGIRWNCPDVRIEWPASDGNVTLSEKDKMLPLLKDFDSPFEYDGTPLRLQIVG